MAGGGGGGGFDDLAVAEEEWADLEPFFFDEAVAVAEHAAAEERRRQKEAKEARKKAEYDRRLQAHQDALERITDYCPKDRRTYFTRFYLADLSKFDLDEESPFGPMRYTNTYTGDGNWFAPVTSANILSVKIVSSDVGFPIKVYGTVIARDSLDYKCVSLFNRDEHHCQLIDSEDDELILTGPKRGLVLVDAIYVEIDLKIKGDCGQQDRELSKGYIMVDGIRRKPCEKMVVERDSLDSKLSTVEVMFAVVKRSTEATITIDVVQGEFEGKITAHTTSIQNSLVLYDSRVAGKVTGDGTRSIQLLRSSVVVCVHEVLIVSAVVGTSGDETQHTVEFNPAVNGGDEAEIACGSFKMVVKVYWSVMSSRHS
ncbi:hypothetical protein HU200_020166 [Digitaria exilis]|uniref:DUF6598 domain-containing protein n=1 Tax=Digitaria exilis TaxID=1010633 RepID=A0A835F1E5_9POAL|nr:hypothetical protein HU200_020166 [Digitaria exilis]